ncbi:calcium-responsive transcription factor-like isoform X1 [Scyliorhinus canicula]|uniref:calcium-responsive transcription factor-like isoform X1 n=1 Tax=Scyliorhinus canicula TaxID=7830 RepID=UPI0018F703F5|nr:calcium-responsive transcription factor-like isoform X1 [Scyliorhinus canicula]XP_038644419.1 calcium-responsive transcription factor-like isoform X1 [Scyliorhinus canicula]XP_038644424.1 calcium-responsive transcription factor-like isoform X1 [Scyliorhinus canicula]XP_038644431.1 calcium-responsive transcription factor-like isoform X1 [Scyliorhinus canicula]XP_038644439.1 calcium-responsive transcription factor-like isoform X1 [Scyliorhinus canicula]
MAEDVTEDEIGIERNTTLLGTDADITEDSEAERQVFQQLAWIDDGESAFGSNDPITVIPITVHITDDSATSQNPTVQVSQQAQTLSTEPFQLMDQNGQPIQYELQSLGDANTRMMIVTSQSENGQVLHVIPSNPPGVAQVLIPQGQILDVTDSHDTIDGKPLSDELQTVTVAAITDNTGYVLPSSLTLPKKASLRIVEDNFPVPLQPLPHNTPAWARRLRSCEKIGDSYRGYCESETELENVLTVHKQQTQSVWGTRQSPSPAKPATRLMWKSQYVPYDGIPFVNAGSRAIVMECQFGPRRKGVQPKKIEQENISNPHYKATCAARIYIKKVRKFPEYRVPIDPKIDKKVIRQEQEKAFNMLKKNGFDIGGVVRWYVQLPTPQAHQYHDQDGSYLPPLPPPPPPPFVSIEEEDVGMMDENGILPSRLHPRVTEKIRELVVQGIDQVYMVRKQLRKFVERELFKPDDVPERHNLSFFPTVNDIKNHIHEAQLALQRGELEYISGSMTAALQWTASNGSLQTETVTVTLASTHGDESTIADSIITKVESAQVAGALTSESTQLPSSLSSLQPKLFAQLQGLQLQSAFGSSDTTTAVVTLNSHQPGISSPSAVLDSRNPTAQQHQVFSQTHFLQLGSSLSECDSAASTLLGVSGAEQNMVSMGQLVTVGTSIGGDTGLDGGVHQILLGSGQTIPIQIMETSTSATVSQERCISQVKEESEDGSLPAAGSCLPEIAGPGD